MSFFLPSRLVDFEYFGTEPDEEYAKIAEPYQNDIDFAFFAVNFGYSKRDYQELTPREKVFIYKAWENKTIADSSSFYNAMFTATYNVNRSKNKHALKLWKKKSRKHADMDRVKENISIIKSVDKKEGKSWIDFIYDKNGLKKPRKEVR